MNERLTRAYSDDGLAFIAKATSTVEGGTL